ncbi:NUDIX hydrolase [Neisseria chenwenguii]|uniref:NUDIX hydrolase n=1 Tax=Neisseria chenwenguii TaxID=1853278 RepID=A0A220S125_9NEIS|nr:NUDIX domain-containing protein [Neisseria chenwenguii]ASK27200.1 NUDIX hydrolase [Neisseria chenwenguii]ROV54902.1 NUDIX domain-containing protein [Neisseria chenwenguii]
MSERPHFSQPLDDGIHDSLWQWAQETYGLKGVWQPLWLNGLPLGRLNDKWRDLLLRGWPDFLRENSDGLHLDGKNWRELGENLQQTAAGWRDSGLLPGWRNELFDVYSADGQSLFPLERSAFRPLGLMSHAVHLNGLVHRDGEWKFWIGRRSPDKAVAPNRLDNMVGGGIASGETSTNAVLRESEEEAGLNAALLGGMGLQNKIRSLRPVSRGLHNEVLHIFDVVLPATVRPKNRDGEVAEFMLMGVDELLAAMQNCEMMHDAQLVTLDAFLRYGLLDPDHDLSKWLRRIRFEEEA